MNKEMVSSKKILLLTGFFFICLCCNAQRAQTLTFVATDFKCDQGMAVAHLFREQDDLPKKPFQQVASVIVNGKAILVFSNISCGMYAAIIFHDKNANGILDHRLGFPNEPMGFSNNWKLSLFSGMPTFKKLRCEFIEDKMEYRIKIH